MDFDMSVFSQFTGNQDNFPVITQYFTTSGTWIAPGNGWAIFTVVGAGGSGASQDSGANARNRATGGAAGGFAVAKRYVTAGTSFTVTIGAGGTGVTGQTAGNPGGASSISASGFTTITANGRLS